MDRRSARQLTALDSAPPASEQSATLYSFVLSFSLSWFVTDIHSVLGWCVLYLNERTYGKGRSGSGEEGEKEIGGRRRVVNVVP